MGGKIKLCFGSRKPYSGIKVDVSHCQSLGLLKDWWSAGKECLREENPANYNTIAMPVLLKCGNWDRHGAG